MADYDVIIIGAGPGGYVSAIRCAQLGLKTALVEGRETLGGTCLNVGCIPSKALLHASHMLHEARHNFTAMGLVGKAPSVNWEKMLDYKQAVVGQNTKGIEFLFKKNKIDWIKGWAMLPKPGEVRVEEKAYTARHVVIATGSEPAALPGVEVDEERIVTSTGALSLAKVPRRLVVIGAGVIGLELGSVYARLGAEVTVVEYLDHIAPGLDAGLAKALQRALKKQGLGFVLGAAVKGVEKLKTKLKLSYELRKDGSSQLIEADTVLVATGRKPFLAGLAPETLGLELTPRGQVKTDVQGRTNLEGVWAIGDVTEGPMLAHKAEEEGIMVAECIAGQAGHVNYGVIPSVIYTSPEVASVGQSEEELKAAGHAYRAGKFSFMANARAKAAFQGEGFVKILADRQTDRILGVHVIGPSAGELIHEACVAMEFGAAAEDLARTCHAHPTFSEAVREAALACGDGAIHA